jgi:hypothetical protein
MGIRRYFKDAEIAQMSNGTYCVIRDLGLVKGGKGLRHHENLLTLSVEGVVSKLVEVVRGVFKGGNRAPARGLTDEAPSPRRAGNPL